jgi:type I restriction enzyme, S subunit
MSSEHLLNHFNQIAEAPDAIPRLRRFILDLAVRGKLVEQDPNDEPASELLKRIEVEKDRLIKAGGMRKEKLLPSKLEDDCPFQIPITWQWSRLAEVGFINPRNSANEVMEVSFVPMPLISATYGIPNSHEVKLWGEIKSGYTHFAEGDVALAKITPCFENGKSTVFRGLTGGIGAGTTELHVLRPVIINSHYVLVFLKSPHFIESGIPRMTGTAGQKRVPTEYFACSPFPLPPLAEQHRIVAKVDELMTLCDELEAAQAKREKRRDRLVAATLHGLNNGGTNPESDASPTFAESARFYFNHLPRLTTSPEHIHQLRQTILNLAVRGKLVPQNPNDEPASELLGRIQVNKERMIKERELRKDKLLPTLSKESVPFSIPSIWIWVRIGNCSLFTNYGTSVKSGHADNGVPVLKMGDIQGGRIILEGQKKVPRSIDDLPQLFLKKYDLLYNRTNSAELVGKTGIFMGEDDNYTFASYLIRIRFICHLTNPVYANLAMNAPYFRETQIIPELKQQCGQANVNGTKLKNMLIPLPPLAEQHRIVAKVDELMTLCDELEEQINTTGTTRRQLLESTLQEALSA